MAKLAKNKSLVDFFTPSILLTISICQTLQKKESLDRSRDEIIADLQNLIQEAQDNALAEGKTDKDVNDSKFAVVAWIDEMFAKYPDWSLGYTPLQIIYFATNNAGNEFYDYLKRIDEHQKELREVYFYVLCLGFTGEYYLETGPNGEIQRLIDQNALLLPQKIQPLNPEERPYLNPQPYLQEDPKPKKPGFPWLKTIFYSLLTLAVLGAIGYAIYLYLQKPDRDQILAEINRILSQYECAEVTAILDDDLKVGLTGHVGSNRDKIRLVNQIRNIDNVSSVTSTLAAYKWPICEAIGILSEFTMQSEGKIGEPRIRPKGGKVQYKDGERLKIAITPPEGRRYIYVDYIQKDGTVIHILPNQRNKNNLFSSSQLFVLGENGDENPVLTIHPPYGLDMMMITTSPVPLFTRDRPLFEPAKDYFDAYKQAVISIYEQGFEQKIQSDYYLISTSE